MSELTINEMLAWLKYARVTQHRRMPLDEQMQSAISAILEQEQMRQERDARSHQEQSPPEIKWADYIKAGGR